MISDIAKTPYVELELEQIPWQDACVHWTGLVFSGRDCRYSPIEVIAFARAEIESMNEKEKSTRKQKWAEFKEALAWQASFWEWFGKRVDRDELRHKGAQATDDEREKLVAEYIARARVYIKNFEESSPIGMEDFTDAVPEAMRKRYGENMKIINYFYSLPITRL